MVQINLKILLNNPLKIYAGFESVLKGYGGSDRNNNTSYTEKYQKHIPCSFAYKIVCVDYKFSKAVVLYRGKNANIRFIETIFKGYDYRKNNHKKVF